MEDIEINKNNLDALPQKKVVYAIYAKDTNDGKPINCRYVGETDNLKERTNKHFSDSEENECLKQFMRSNLTKILVFELLPNSDKDERLKKEAEWINKLKLKCNK